MGCEAPGTSQTCEFTVSEAEEVKPEVFSALDTTQHPQSLEQSH